MSNHVHLIIRINEVPLETVFRKLNTHYACWFNKTHKRIGHLQQGRYYSEPIEDENYLLAAITYIHKNPLKASLEDEIGKKYFWNSFHQYYFDFSKTIIAQNKLLSNQTQKYNQKIPDFVDTEDIFEFITPTDFINLHNESCDLFKEYQKEFLELENIKKRKTDEEAITIIYKITNCRNCSELQNFSFEKLIKLIPQLIANRISVAQLSRITGITKSYIRKILFLAEREHP